MKKRILLAQLFLLFLAGGGFAEMNGTTEKATFAGGCFWGMEKAFGEIEGVVSTRVGYTGGVTPNPSYEIVCSGRTGHAEAIEVTFDPKKVSYEDLVEFFFTHHDPTTPNRQGNDIGSQYRSAIFYHSPAQQAAAMHAIEVINKAAIFKRPIVTEVVHATEFYPAENYHQKYLQKNPHGYCAIQYQSPKISQALKQARKEKSALKKP